MFAPYLLLAKIAAIVALIAGAVFGVHQVTEHWRNQGRAEIQIKLDARDSEVRVMKNTIALEAKNKAINLGVIDGYHKKLDEQNKKHRADINDLRVRGGLRLPENTCRGFAASTAAADTGGADEAGGTRLPEQIENDLYDYAEDRDKEIIQLGAIQRWAIEHGFAKQQ